MGARHELPPIEQQDSFTTTDTRRGARGQSAVATIQERRSSMSQRLGKENEKNRKMHLAYGVKEQQAEPRVVEKRLNR